MRENKSQSLTKRAAFALRQQIIQGRLAGGTRLFEVALSEELQISRTPVREAMSRLAEEGLLERAPGGGFQVRAFSYDDVADAIELRGVLEGTAARFAAERGISGDGKVRLDGILAELDTCFDPRQQEVNFDKYSEYNALFHSALIDLSASPVLAREIERVTRLPFASPSAFVLGKVEAALTYESLAMAQMQHRAIAEAVVQREGARAEAIGREHARIARANLDVVFKAEPAAGAGLPGRALIVDKVL